MTAVPSTVILHLIPGTLTVAWTPYPQHESSGSPPTTTHGSSWLAREAVAAVVEAAQRGEDPLELARELVRARPDIGAIAGALGRVLVAGRTTEQLVEEAEALIGSRERAAATIAVLLRARARGAGSS